MSFRIRYQDVQQVSYFSASKRTQNLRKAPETENMASERAKNRRATDFLCIKMLSITRHVAPSPRRGRCSAPPALMLRWFFYRSFSQFLYIMTCRSTRDLLCILISSLKAYYRRSYKNFGKIISFNILKRDEHFKIFDYKIEFNHFSSLSSNSALRVPRRKPG